MLAEQLMRVGPRKRRLARKQFVKHTAETVNIRPLIDSQTANLLRRHVALRSLYLAGPLQQLSQSTFPPPREIKVDQLHFAFLAHQEVIRLYVAMHPPL